MASADDDHDNYDNDGDDDPDNYDNDGYFSHFGGTENGILGARIKILKLLFNPN